MKPTTQKCAIYTRKSTDKGLEQDFNTLDAQREACLAYITSQKSEGWIAVKQLYDDGGYSGGSMERPALKQLMEDIKDRKINIVVVYKIDRLTRSLTDFAKLVEVFDQYGVSFVSITQSFNTTTSMGRLTLNVLLSFAQFEREVIGERIRDKVAASKKKGMWMGGCPMLGYDIKERQLVINEQEAKTIRYIFDSYLEFGAVSRLKEHLDMRGIKSKSWVSKTGKEHPGQPYSRGAIYHLLSNPVYAGYIRHRGVVHEGLHEGIISKEKWQQVQGALMSKACIERGHKNQSVKSILKGKIFDADGIIYTPMRANKKGKQYRYYVSQNRVQNRDSVKGVIARLPAHEIETLVLNSMVAKMKDIEKLSGMLGLDVESNHNKLERISKSAENITDLYRAIHKVVVDVDRLTVDVCVKTLAECINEIMGVGLAVDDDAGVYSLSIPYHTKRARKGAVVIRSGAGRDLFDLPKNKLKSLVKGIIWRDAHFRGKPFIEIARENNCSRSFVIQLVQQSLEIA
jgi:DNA invertase Pin-like site-specific DNA recombinase